MQSVKKLPLSHYRPYLRKQSLPHAFNPSYGQFGTCNLSTSPPDQRSITTDSEAKHRANELSDGQTETGSMSKRLEQMTLESLEQSGRSAEKTIEEAGFSEELKIRLLEKVKDNKFKSDNPVAFAQTSMPVWSAIATVPRSIN